MKRQSNIELCRIFSILFVMILHSTFNAIAREAGEPSFIIYYISALSIIGVDVFVLITGYFSVIPKKTSLINLAFICLFWMLIKIICRSNLDYEINFTHYFFITSSNWFIPCYIGLLFMAPILNAFCDKASKKQLLGGVISLIIIQVWFDLLPPYPNLRLGSHEGYSFFSFAVLYLLGRALRLYGIPKLIKKTNLLAYLLLSLPTAWFATETKQIDNILFAYNSPLVIASAVCFFAFFVNLNFESRSINHIAKSILAVLLGHTAIMRTFNDQFRYIFHQYSGLELVGLWIFSIVLVFFACIGLDQIRLLIYKPIRSYLKKNINKDELF